MRTGIEFDAHGQEAFAWHGARVRRHRPLPRFRCWLGVLAFVLASPALGQTDGASAESQALAMQSVMGLAPDSAVITWALPPATRLYDKARMLAARFSAPDSDRLADIDGLLASTRQATGLDDDATLSEILLAQGLDPATPSCVFLDPAPATARARDTVELVATGGTYWKTTPPSARKTPEYDWFDLDLIHVVAVFGCSDGALAERCVARLVATVFGGNMLTDEACPEGVIHVHESGVAWSVAGRKLFVTNHVPMLKETLSRIAAPVPVRYGSPTCPASTTDPIVCVTRMDRLRAILPDLTNFLKRVVNPGQDPQATNEAFHLPDGMFVGGEPCITTIDATEDKMEIVSWLDLSSHSPYADQIGKPRPIRLGEFVPETCQAFGCVQLTDSIKALLRKRWVPLRSSEEGDAIEGLRSFDFLNGEVAAGVAADGASAPRMFLLADISDPEAVKTFAGTVAPGVAWTPDPRVPGIQFAEFPPDLCVALGGNVLLVTNGNETCRTLAESLIAKKGTPLLESRIPPIDRTTPVFGICSLKTEHLDTILPFLAELAGASFSEMAGPFGSKLSAMFRECRAGKVTQGDWQKAFLSLYWR